LFLFVILKEFLTATFHPFYYIFTSYNTDIIHQVFLCNWFNINMWVPISFGGLFSEKILLSVRNFPTFVFTITTFHLFKKYYNTYLQSKTFYILNKWRKEFLFPLRVKYSYNHQHILHAVHHIYTFLSNYLNWHLHCISFSLN
jgi:hypothetical protein